MLLAPGVVVDDHDIVSPPDRSHIGVRFDLRVEMTGYSTLGRSWLHGPGDRPPRDTT